MSGVPTIGRIVHYWPGDGPYQPAIITRVHEIGERQYALDLTVFPPGEPPKPVTRILHADAKNRPANGPYWLWPPLTCSGTKVPK